jgi:hypothetical protein
MDKTICLRCVQTEVGYLPEVRVSRVRKSGVRAKEATFSKWSVDSSDVLFVCPRLAILSLKAFSLVLALDWSSLDTFLFLRLGISSTGHSTMFKSLGLSLSELESFVRSLAFLAVLAFAFLICLR